MPPGVSTRLAMFGVRRKDARLATICRQLGRLAEELVDENDFDDVYLAAIAEAESKKCGLHLFAIYARPAEPDAIVPRGFFGGRWEGRAFLHYFVYDGQTGGCLCESWREDAPLRQVINDGPFLFTPGIELAEGHPLAGRPPR